ncbi:MAG: copper-binding protein [Pseudomonadota bacterium]
MILKLSSLAVAAALTLVACGGSDQAPEPSAETMSEGPMDHAGHDMSGDTGHALGTIVSVADGELGIAHGPIEGIGMGAMTMLFGTMGDVDATAFAEGDEVFFMVKRGRDGSYRIMAICDTGEAGADCLGGMMQHDD